MVEYVNYKGPRGPRIYRISKYSFSSIELEHLSIALVLITLALMALNRSQVSKIGIVNFVLIYFFTIGLGFLLHELGHKFVAQYYGFISEFRADFMMMIVAIFIAYFGFLFLAPGAVIILGRPTRRQNGIISVAGPLVNLVLALIFIFIKFVFLPANAMILYIVNLGIWINGFLGIFNMLPFWVLDGKKVLLWNKTVYFIVFIAFLGILGFSYNGII